MKKIAFTLIELLVVITLIGIITAIMAPSYLRYYQRENLKNATLLLKSGFSEAFSLARSRSKHIILSGKRDAENFVLKRCETLDCSQKTVINDPDTQKFSGKVKIVSEDFEIKFLAPHGDLVFLNTSETTENIEIKLQNTLAEKTLKIYKKSGLVTTE